MNVWLNALSLICQFSVYLSKTLLPLVFISQMLYFSSSIEICKQKGPQCDNTIVRMPVLTCSWPEFNPKHTQEVALSIESGVSFKHHPLWLKTTTTKKVKIKKSTERCIVTQTYGKRNLSKDSKLRPWENVIWKINKWNPKWAERM